MNIIINLVIIIYILFILNIYIIIEIYNYEIRKMERKLYNKLVSIREPEPELVSIREPDHDNIYNCIDIAQNNYALDLYFIKNTNNTNNTNKFNHILSSLKDELHTCNILYNNTLINNNYYESYKQIKEFLLSKCDEEYFDYYIYNIYSGEICNEFETLNSDCSQFNIITLILGLERCNINFM